MSWSFDVSASTPPLSCRCSSLQSIHRIDCSAARTVPHPLLGGDRPAAGPLPSQKTRPGCCPPVPLHFFSSRSDRDGRGAASCLVSLSLGGTFQRPVRRFLPATSVSLRRRPLSGIFQAGPVLMGTGGRPHTLDNPILPPCHATQALRARCQGRQGIWPSKAFTLAPTSPGGDHFPRTRKLGSCVSPPTSAPAPPRHNALWCIRGRNGSEYATARKGGDKFKSPSLFLHENPACSSPVFRDLLRGC